MKMDRMWLNCDIFLSTNATYLATLLELFLRALPDDNDILLDGLAAVCGGGLPGQAHLLQGNTGHRQTQRLRRCLCKRK